MSHAEYRISLPARTDDDEDPAVAAVLSKAKAGIGMIPNMYANMANAPALLDTYMTGYAAFRAESGFSATEQEIVFLTISRINGCSYCLAAHSTIADRTKVPAEIVASVRQGTTLRDPKLDALATFTATMVKTCGQPTRRSVQAFLAAGYHEASILQIILAVAVKTISNYSNHLFHTEVDAAFAARA